MDKRRTLSVALVGLGFVVSVLAVTMIWFIHRCSERQSASILQLCGGHLYASQGGIYQLDVQSGEWVLRHACVNASHQGDVAMHNSHMYVALHNRIEVLALDSNSVIDDGEYRVNYAPSHLAVSRDGKMIAYIKQVDSNFSSQAVMVMDLASREETMVASANSYGLAWSTERTSLVLEDEHMSLTNLTIETGAAKAMCTGYKVVAVGADQIGYCVLDTSGGRDDVVFIVRDTETGQTKEAGRMPRSGFQGWAWHPDGRYFAVARIERGRIGIGWQTQLTIIDSQTLAHNDLPPFPMVTGCIVWTK